MEPKDDKETARIHRLRSLRKALRHARNMGDEQEATKLERQISTIKAELRRDYQDR